LCELLKKINIVIYTFCTVIIIYVKVNKWV